MCSLVATCSGYTSGACGVSVGSGSSGACCVSVGSGSSGVVNGACCVSGGSDSSGVVNMLLVVLVVLPFDIDSIE